MSLNNLSNSSFSNNGINPNINSLVVANNASVGGNLTVSGSVNPNSITTNSLTVNGNINVPTLSANLPVKTNGLKNLITSAINLSSSEITNTLGVSNGGTGNSGPLVGDKLMVSLFGGSILEGTSSINPIFTGNVTSNGNLYNTPTSATSAGTSATLDSKAGVVTFTGQVLGAGSFITYTINNNVIGSNTLLSHYSNLNSTVYPYITNVIITPNTSLVFDLFNPTLIVLPASIYTFMFISFN